MSNIGFVGIGLMGRGMVRTLARQGHQLRIYNRTRAKAEEAAASLPDGPVEVVDSPAAAARGAEYVFTMLADPEAVLECFQGSDGILAGLAPGTVVIDSSTISPAVTQQVAALVAGKGANLLDAPVFGSKNEAENGKLGFLIGGDEQVFEAAKTVLNDLGTANYMGGPGMGVCAKLTVNLMMGGAMQAFNEGMVMARKSGLDAEKMFNVVMGCRAKSGIIEMKGPNILQRNFDSFFTLRLMDKDMRLALETGQALGVPMPCLAALKQVYTDSLAAGLGNEDFSATIKLLERAAAVEVKSN